MAVELTPALEQPFAINPNPRYFYISPQYKKVLNHAIATVDKREGLLILEGPIGCHQKGQPILMFGGSVKPVEDIVVGDQLMGPDSTPRQVLQLHRGHQQMARIVPTKGEPWVVNLDHILTLVETESGRVVDVSVREWLGWSKTAKSIYKLFRTGVEFPTQPKPLPIDPYLLGLLLGDGHMRNPPVVYSADPEIVEFMCSSASKMGLSTVSRNPGTSRLGTGLSSRGIPGQENPVTHELRALGLYLSNSGNKFIPEMYKTAGRRERLELLAGLMDTDGCVHGSGFDFVSKSKVLADDVAYVARSLGFAAYVKECLKSCQTGAVGTYHRVLIEGHCSEVPTKIARKRAPIRRQKKNPLRTGFQVELLDDDDYYGFTVDGDHRYLLGDFTVTHNCGKSSLFRFLIDWLQEAMVDKVELGIIYNPSYTTPFSFLKAICKEFDLDPKQRYDEQLEAFKAFLFEKYRAGKTVVLLIDEAHRLPGAQLELVREFFNFSNDSEFYIQVILAGEAKPLRHRLSYKPAIVNRASYYDALKPLTLDEACELIRYRLTKSELDPESFTPEAIAAMHTASGGIPRTLIKIAKRAFEEAEGAKVTAPAIAELLSEFPEVAGLG